MADINGSEDLSIRDSLTAALESATPAPGPDSSPDPVEAPSEQTPADEAAAAQRARDDKGRFAAKDGAEPAKDTAQPDATKPVTQVAAEQPADAAAEKPGSPPPGWSPASKAAWHDGKLPPEVIRDIAKREAEINNGFARLREYKPLDNYIEAAKRNNTSLPDVIERYMAAEQQLERNPIEGIAWLAKNYNVDGRQLAAALGINAGSQAQPGNGQQPVSQQPQAIDLRSHLSPLQKELEDLKSMIFGEREAQTLGQVEAFFADPANRYADNVVDQMAALLQSKQVKTLKDAYEQACWLNPEVRTEILKDQRTKEQADQAAKAKQVASQARAAARSITGAPTATTLPGSKPDDLRATLEEAFRGSARV